MTPLGCLGAVKPQHNQQRVASHLSQSIGHQSLLTKHQSLGTGQRAWIFRHWAPEPVTRHQSPGSWLLHWSTVTGHQSPGTGHQLLDTRYWVADYRHSLSSEQSVTNEPQSSVNKQRLLLPLEPDFNTLSDPSIIIEPPRILRTPIDLLLLNIPVEEISLNLNTERE